MVHNDKDGGREGDCEVEGVDVAAIQLAKSVRLRLINERGERRVKSFFFLKKKTQLQ